MRTGTARNIAWSGAEAIISAGFSVVSVFVVARLIGPAEVGIGAAAVAAHVLLWVGVNALFADAIVQQSAEVDDQTCASAFWASVLVGVCAAIGQALAGWPLAWALGDSRLVPMSLVLAIPLPLVGAAGVIQGRVTRERHYKLLAGRALIGQGLGTTIGIASALGGAGAWALASQQAVTSACGALTLLVGAGWWPAPVLRWRPVRHLLRTGGPLTASTLVLHGRYRMFAVMIGGTAGAASLGQVHLA
ncbi:MAG: oligosaccharide flippase family protein, partial [Acetobacteraceae bacterium]